MKKILLMLGLLLMCTPLVSADTYVEGYYRKDGTYVAPHYRSDADGRTDNNWSEKGNQNPYTGKWGNKDSNEQYEFGNDPYKKDKFKYYGN